MLGRSHRFHGYNSVLPVYRQAKMVRTDGCSLHFAPNNRRQQYRLAVVVSKKVAKSAVTRNRIRRRIYEVSKHHLAADTAYDLIISVFDADIATQPHQKIEKTITSLFEKSGISSR